MARPSNHTDRKLINAARKLLPEKGFSQLNLRQVARHAQVNLGMFHYHFGSKPVFIREVLQDIYEDFYRELTSALKIKGKSAKSRLRTSLIVLAKFVRDNKNLMNSIMSDALRGDPEVTAFITKNAPRHGTIIMSLIAECQRDGSLEKIPLHQAIAFLASAINFPNIVATAIGRSGRAKPHFLNLLKLEILSDAAIVQRVDLALKGLSS